MSITEVTDTVKAIGAIAITGNVIPAAWWRNVLLKSGRPDSTAIVLLSEIVYWYRPSEVRAETTGEVMAYRKRFHGDKLQRSYQAFADQFGFSKREATDALKRLRDAGLITLELRTVRTPEGMVLSNVLFIEPMPEAIKCISSVTLKSDAKNVTPVTFQRNTSSVSTETLLHSDVEATTLKRGTYTEITTEITTENKTYSQPDKQSDDLPGKTEKQKTKQTRIDYQEYIDAYNEILGDRLPWAKVITDKRRAALKRLLPKLKTANVEGFSAYLRAFSKMARSFYFGENDRGWRADIDYILKEQTLVAVREGSIGDSEVQA